MYMFLHKEMLDSHVTDEAARKKLDSDILCRRIFDSILVGVNIISIDCINDIAVFVTSLDRKQLLSVTLEDVSKAVGQYEDTSGRLV